MTLHTPRADAIRDPSGLWSWMRFFVLVAILSYLIAIAVTAITWTLYARLISLTLPQAQVLDSVFAFDVIAMSALLYFCAFFVMRLTYRLMKNVHERGADEELISPGWAVGWYFVPFASLAMPPRAVGQIWRATFRPDVKSSSIIGWWWACFLISGFVLTFVGLGSIGADRARPMDHDTRMVSLAFQTLGYALRCLAAIFMLRVFGTIVRGQRNFDSVADTFA